MKKLVIILTVILLYSCSDAKMDYSRKEWIHKGRMLDVEYKNEILSLKNQAELELLIKECDSIYKTIEE